MHLFERIVLVFIGIITASLFLIAAYLPGNWATYSPEATFKTPGNLKVITSLRERQQNLITASSLSEAFNQIKYDFNSIRNGQILVPRLFVKSLPVDMGRIKDQPKFIIESRPTPRFLTRRYSNGPKYKLVRSLSELNNKEML